MLTIGLLNNMPPAAIPATERQFQTLLAEAAREMPVRLRWFRLSGAKPAHYESLDELWSSTLDGLIVTGAEPKARSLPDEPLWHPLIQTVAWAADNTISTIFSCLAAHAAVLYLDGVDRRLRTDKIFGLFGSVKAIEHDLLAGFPPVWRVPHSRWNDLPESDLIAAGYAILAKSADAGVDLFVKSVARSLFIFIQTHPEYDGDSLIREYHRDLARFDAGQHDYCPRIPRAYSEHDETALDAIRNEMITRRGNNVRPTLGQPAISWFPEAVQLYRNWIRHLTVNRVNRVTIGEAA